MHPPGRILRKRLLETVADYRVIEDDGRTVTVEVVEAPGLATGFRMRLNAADAEAMETVGEPGEEPSGRRVAAAPSPRPA